MMRNFVRKRAFNSILGHSVSMIRGRFPQNTKGTALINLCIVVIIVLIFFGAAIKGQAIIHNSKIKSLTNQHREILAAIYSYHDRYSYIPGDDPNAATRWAGTVAGNGNGFVAVGVGSTGFNYTCAASGMEQCDLWNQLRLSKLIPGSGFFNPKNAYGGHVAFSYYRIQGLLAHWLAFQDIPHDVCRYLDEQSDDGNHSSGQIRGSGNYDTATSGVFNLYFRF